ncbi:response regulator [Collinsella sp. OM07-12]|uniref:HD domain-containing phosphohydrolase n=1 Tax=Collinsella sp. OM07-12 TaxID=2292328 RepID=UPI000E43AFEF|nr:HD domain-containing phosphohydrolase [Collinsella sp. OM07-12]RGM70617.1 response regulator [Collinsella sp. OM07-12]
MSKQKVLIVDDSEMNRALLTDILEGSYDVAEAEDGAQAIEVLSQNDEDFWLVLLDIIMPGIDGFGVLESIREHQWSNRVVVMMISSDGSPENINRAYSLGAFDYISRPFDAMIVHRRVENTLMLFARQDDLERRVKEQVVEQQKNNDLMISILSHIVEFRNGESGPHIQHVKGITELLLQHLLAMTDQYQLTEDDIQLIVTASALHDIGKVAIPEEILNKPGRLTDEEFAIMKSHSAIGSQMLLDLPEEQLASPLISVANAICRWHHERYDGRGYPDGLVGEEIPICAQVVSLADVYDALTSERSYKKAFSHEKALSMIIEGQCGTFNPLLLQCLTEASDELAAMKGIG